MDFYALHYEKERKFVEIETVKGPLKGYLHVIDPESGNLMVQCTDSLVILWQNTVTSLKLMKAGTEEQSTPTLTSFETRNNTQESLSCDHLLKEFRKRLIDARVVLREGEKHISLFDGVAWIVPPYDLSSSYSENETVLARLHHMLSDIMDQKQSDMLSEKTENVSKG